jgi:TPR repeat protein
MRSVPAAFLCLCLLVSLLSSSRAPAEPLDLNTIKTNETPEQLCDRLVDDPFVGFGPSEWAHPFDSIDPYRAVPACVKAMRAHPGERGYVLKAGFAFVAANKNDAAKKLLERLTANNDASAMLGLAYIAPEAKAAEFMRRASEQGNATAMMLLGMSRLTGKGVPQDQIEGVRLLRKAAENGSTRAMLLLANFHNEGAYGVGYNPEGAKRLIAEAAARGDPRANDLLANARAPETN